MQSSLPERKSRSRPRSFNVQPITSLRATYTSWTFLLRVCWLLLGSTVVIVFGLSLVVVLLKRPYSPPAATVEETFEQQETESQPPSADDNSEKVLPPVDPLTRKNEQCGLADESNRVLGGSVHSSRPDDAPSVTDLPPLASPPLATTNPTNPSPSAAQQPSPPIMEDADAALEKRLQLSAEDLRKQLLAVPEVRLFSDLIVQKFREEEKIDERTVKGLSRNQIDFAFNVQMNQYMRQAALKEGLPILSGPSCQLNADTAMIVQALSKDLREMGFVSVPGAPARVRFKPSGRGTNAGPTTIHTGSPNEKIEAFEKWCDVNTIEKLPGAVATLVQLLQVEDEPTRLLMVRELAKTQGPGVVVALATAALVDLSNEVRKAAVVALEKRPSEPYLPVLLQGFRYPWPAVADHAAVALRKLRPEGAVPKLIALLDRPDPSLPVLDQSTKKPVVRELVRLNHLRNCLLCHAPSANDKDGFVHGLVPTPGEALPRLYYAGQRGNFIRADRTFLRQDFSVSLPVAASAPWPTEQRFDFVTRLRPAEQEEMLKIAPKSAGYPQREAALYALRGLTGLNGGDSSAKWVELLDNTARK